MKWYEYSYFDLQTPLNANVGANNQQTKDNYLFVVDNNSEANPIDWYYSYLEVNFKLLATDQDQDGATIRDGTGNVNLFSTTTNGSTFIREIQVECHGITVYNNTSSNGLSLLKYTKEYANTVVKDNFFYLDTSTGTAEPRSAEALYNQGYSLRKILTDAGNENKISMALNIYSYFFLSLRAGRILQILQSDWL